LFTFLKKYFPGFIEVEKGGFIGRPWERGLGHRFVKCVFIDPGVMVIFIPECG
jgi:hypothetical protein